MPMISTSSTIKDNRNMCRGRGRDRIGLSDIAESVHSSGVHRMRMVCGGRRNRSGRNISVAVFP